jgi:hypothetical protein
VPIFIRSGGPGLSGLTPLSWNMTEISPSLHLQETALGFDVLSANDGFLL